jgi:hypothetical protein
MAFKPPGLFDQHVLVVRQLGARCHAHERAGQAAGAVKEQGLDLDAGETRGLPGQSVHIDQTRGQRRELRMRWQAGGDGSCHGDLWLLPLWDMRRQLCKK